MDFVTFVRKPFIVEALEITEDNMEEVSNLIGKVDKDEDGKPCIVVTRKGIPGVPKVYPGFWLTKMGSNIRCYSSKAFTNQFVEGNSEIDKWVEIFSNHNDGESDG